MKMQRKMINFTLLAFAILSLPWVPFGSKDALAVPPVQRMELPNGLVVIVLEERTLPFVTLTLLADAGSRRDPSGQGGLAHITSKAMLRGTSERSATTIYEELDFMGASLSSSCTQDFATFSLKTLTKDLDKSFGIFLDTLLKPAFPEDEIQRQVEETLGEIRSSEDQPMEVAQRAFRKAIFPDSTYGHPVKGTEESLGKVTRDAVVGFYKTYYHPGHSILTISGDISADEVKNRLIPLLEKWPAGKIPAMPAATPSAQGPTTIEIDRPLTQAGVMIGHGGVERTNPDYYAISVMNFILGGGTFSSRLMEEIRVKRGLAYAIDSSFVFHKNSGAFQIEVQTKNSSVQEVISLSVQQMERIQNEPVSEEELDIAKKYLVGSFPLRFSSQDALNVLFAQIEFFGLGMDYPERYPSLINSITREDVQRVAKTYLHPDKRVVVIVGEVKKDKPE
jgi:zinc protease